MATYRSNYGADRDISAAEKLTEVVCERIAFHKKTTLVTKFWSTTAWKRAYAAQVQAAHRLLKLYDPEAVFAALRGNPWFRSLGPAFVSDAVRAEQEKIDRRIEAAKQAAPTTQTDATQGPRQGLSKAGSVRKKLQGL